ncbi:MAG TPA: hypothetical protein PKC19_11670 [Roseiflexaceae bacterium]|nr:hypothetical protein [Roseiflexaceae bacterium]
MGSFSRVDRQRSGTQARSSAGSHHAQPVHPHVANIMHLQRQIGNRGVQQLLQRSVLLQREDEDALTTGAGISDIASSAIETYTEYAYGETPARALKSLSGILGAFGGGKGATGDTLEGLPGMPTSMPKLSDAKQLLNPGAIGKTGKLASGLSGLTSAIGGAGDSIESASQSTYLGSLFGGMSSLSKSVGDYLPSMGSFGSNALKYTKMIGDYATPLSLIGSGGKAISGASEGWAAGTTLQKLNQLKDTAKSKDIQRAAELLAEIAWWKRLIGYGKVGVGAIESGSNLLPGVGKALTGVMTKGYESGWMSYLGRGALSKITNKVYSNEQMKQLEEQKRQELDGLITRIVANVKVAEVVRLYKIIRDDMGDGGLAKQIEDGFASGDPNRKKAFDRQK